MSDCTGILLSSGTCITMADMLELHALAKMKHVPSPVKVKIPVLADDAEDAILQIFPDFPVSERYRTPDALRSLRRQWYKKQGFHWNGALVSLNPCWLLVADEIDVTSRRNIGDTLWNQILRWRETNKDKIDLLK